MPYNCHTSKKLQDCFIKQPWQGNNPKKARFLFVGLDANFDKNIENNPSFFKEEILTYLEDGVGYWQKRGFHHPFIHPDYRGDGKRYHEKFAEIGFTPENAGLVSFVELLHLPTIGGNALISSDLSADHLRKLNNIFDNGDAKYIFVSQGVTKLIRQTRMFPRLNLYPLPMDGSLKVLGKENGKIIYEMNHFAVHYREQVIVLERQIAQIREIVRNFVGG